MRMINQYALTVITLSLFIIFPASPVLAHMAIMGEDELSDVTAQSGVSIDISPNTLARITFGSWTIGDSSGSAANTLEFNNIVIDNGAGGSFSLGTADQPFTFDVGANPFNHSQTVGLLTGSDAVNPRYISVGSMVFCGQDIGSLDLQAITQNDRSLEFGPHANGGCGIDFEYATKMDIAAIQYTYNTQPQSLLLTGVHLCQSASGSPEDPSTWSFAGAFQIGNLGSNYNPATLDVGTDTSLGKTVMVLNLPMQGDIRINNVNFGGNSFGPCALDGINIHRLSIELIPGS